MFFSEFVWCDLSTFDLAKAIHFYTNVFGWTHHADNGAGDDDYRLLDAGSASTAGIFAMPDDLQKIRMPSFWMSYVQVEHLEDALEKAIQLGAKCEIEPTIYDANIHFALIRDPAGAGFTLYQGPALEGRDLQGRHGRMTWNELHVPSLELVGDFYRQLFGWEIEPYPMSSDRYAIQTQQGDPLASILTIDDAIKGPKNYWAVYFAVEDIEATAQAIQQHGGTIVVPHNADIGQYALATDDQGAAFCLADS